MQKLIVFLQRNVRAHLKYKLDIIAILFFLVESDPVYLE
ncbi:hypothetical protein A1OE_1374 [Candidatus Endolissoclinum faulkneri L2]|uniref:Uncharacterized protein n=1 Tax=Candidatus Endolissoclinum faulkneri L2 TaxID=1193729 RepID=K7YIV3_9PROT|nr:hypothetical protein A1OE_1374 [Candidatus Endolissoclinum faulkneri L2]